MLYKYNFDVKLIILSIFIIKLHTNKKNYTKA